MNKIDNVKVIKETNNPIEINGTSLMQLVFEIGDVFIDKDNNLKAIKYIYNDKVRFTDKDNKESFETLPLTDEFRSKYRYSGTINNKDFPPFEDSFSLIFNK